MKEFSKSGGFQVGGASMHPGHLPTCPMDGVTWSQQKGETPKEGTTGTRCSTCWRVPPGESMVQRIDSLNFWCKSSFLYCFSISNDIIANRMVQRGMYISWWNMVEHLVEERNKATESKSPQSKRRLSRVLPDFCAPNWWDETPEGF